MLTTIRNRALFALCVGATPCLGALTNGDFSAGLGTEWNPAGNVAVQTARPGTPVANPYAILREENSNGLSRIHQTFTKSAVLTDISFRFAFFTSGPTATGPMPPDSFSVFLLDSGGEPIVTAGSGAPSGFKGFLYFDSKGETFQNPSVLTLMAPDAHGFMTATVRPDL